MEQTRRCPDLGEVWVATDSDRIASAVEAAGGRAVRTRRDHPSGLDRVAEAAGILAREAAAGSGRAPDSDAVFVNVQGDEPFVSPEGLTRLIALFDRPEVRMGTIAAPFPHDEDLLDPSRVKVVVDRDGRALYFSRAPIPHGAEPEAARLLHVGVYAYRLRTLEELSALPPAPPERIERLEQLRALWNGIPIHVALGDYVSIGIDTPADLVRARNEWEGRIRR
jgi:3-deoxy-manno-octulosonate cytidylyltransferase (CMP-KDO synthetase)